MNNKYVWFALLLMAIVYLSFFINFYYYLNYRVSDDSTHWGQFGDYVGGLLNPVLSFISMVLLIKSLNIQIATNEKTNEELNLTKKIEKQRSFESLFFNLLESQRSLFSTFKVDQGLTTSSKEILGTQAVIHIEDEIQNMRDQQKTDDEITNYLQQINEHEKVYAIIRAFYVTVKLINEKLTDDQGFELKDRKFYLSSLINLTDFSQLRLIMMGLKFLNYPPCRYLKNDQDFNSVLESVGLDYNLY